MTLQEIAEKLKLTVRCGEDRLDKEVERGYVSDLMSDVIANTRQGDVWITLQIHINIVAVAVMKELSGIIIIGGREPEEETLQKAREEGLPLLVTPLTAFETAGKLYQSGLTGT